MYRGDGKCEDGSWEWKRNEEKMEGVVIQSIKWNTKNDCWASG